MSTGTIPRQTLTFLFADLRDYTAFVERHGDAAAAALIADYRRLVRGEVAKAGGGEIKTEGDSFYVVFSSAGEALRCATAILRQASRYTAERPDRPLRIGVGLHAGEPVPHEGQYVGSAVNLAARLADAARAGELLVSEIVRGLLRTSGAPAMVERGDIVLKGVADAPRAYAVSWQSPSSEATGAPRITASVPAEPPADLRILCPRVIGREKELATLGGFLAEAAAGTGRLVLVAGDAGLGKSALLRAFAERARDGGTRFLVGECSEIEARRPFGPFVQILRAAFRELSAKEVERSLRENAVELLRLLPELAGGPPGADALEASERYRIHESFASLFRDLARGGPLVLAVEDVHWADEATLELFPYLARRLRDEPILLVATYRGDELHRLHPLNHALAELDRGRLAERVRLRKLSLGETADVIRAALGLKRAPTREFCEAIHAHCEGNAFFIEEVLKALVERGDLVYRDGAWEREKEVAELAIPESVRDAVQQRMRLLTAEARRALQVAAVIGQRFDFALLQRVSKLDEAPLLDALRVAIDAQLVEEVPDHGTEELYGFRHALTRESVLAELLQRERRLLHRAVGEAIEADAASRAEELAYHFDEARDQQRAQRYHDLAAREAMRAFAFARAVRHLERAVELAPDDDPALPELQVRLAQAAFVTGDLSRTVRSLEEAAAAYRAAGNVLRLGDTLRSLGFARWQLGETEAAHELATEALALLEPLGETAELAGAYEQTAVVAGLANRYDECRDYAERAITLGRKLGTVEAEVVGLQWLGMVKARRGDPSGLADMRAAIALSDRNGLHLQTLRGYTNLIAVFGSLGAPLEEQRAVLSEALGLMRRVGIRFEPTLNGQTIFAFIDGDWDRALALIEEARSASIWSASREILEPFIAAMREGPDRGRALVEAPRARLLRAGDPQWVVQATNVPMALHRLSADRRGELAEAERVARYLSERYEHWMLDTIASFAILAALDLHDAMAAARWIELAETPSLPRKTAEGRRLVARAAQAELAGRRQDALDRYEEALGKFDEARGTALATLIRQRRAELLLQQSDREAAAAELPRVLPYWRRAKATWYLGELRKWAEERGLPFPEES